MVHGVELIREGYFGSSVRTHYDMGYMAACCLVLTLVGLFLVRDAGRRVGEPLISIENVSKTYGTRFGPRKVLDRVNLTLERGRNIGILGRNGAGKSTLIRLLSGAERPDLGPHPPRDERVSWPLAFTGAFQAHLTGLDNLKFVCRVYGVDWKPLVPFVEEFTELGLYLREPVVALLDGHDDAAGVRSLDGDRVRLLPDRRRRWPSATHASAIAATSSCSRSARTARSSSSRTTRTSIKLYCERACVLHEGRLHEFQTVDEAYEFYEIGRRLPCFRRSLFD